MTKTPAVRTSDPPGFVVALVERPTHTFPRGEAMGLFCKMITPVRMNKTGVSYLLADSSLGLFQQTFGQVTGKQFHILEHICRLLGADDDGTDAVVLIQEVEA